MILRWIVLVAAEAAPTGVVRGRDGRGFYALWVEAAPTGGIFNRPGDSAPTGGDNGERGRGIRISTSFLCIIFYLSVHFFLRLFGGERYEEVASLKESEC
jgi:hypothetical protein